jgi:hypothetical protein
MTALQDNGDRRAGDKSAGAEHLGQVLREMTAGTGLLGRDSREKTAETGLPGQDNLERTARTGQPEGTVGEARAGGRGQDGHITVRTRQLEQGNREGTTAAGQP